MENNILTDFIELVFCIWAIICLWRIFVKAWEKWWKSLIPFYNVYIQCKIVGKPKWFWWLMLLPIIGIIRTIVSIVFWILNVNNVNFMPELKAGINWVLWFSSVIAIIITIVFAILTQIRLWKAFWKSAWFCVWLVFLNFIFAGVIAFDDSKYSLSNLEKECKKWK